MMFGGVKIATVCIYMKNKAPSEDVVFYRLCAEYTLYP